MKELGKLRERYDKMLMQKENVVGVGIGYKTVKGRKTGELSLVVLVEKKVPLPLLKKKDVVDTTLEGIPTDVQEVGKFQALNQNTRLQKWRPAPGGVSIGHYKVTAGTLGTLVRDKNTGEVLILSNNHVLANSNDALIGDPVLQPGSYDGGTEKDAIAHLERFVPVKFLFDVPTCPIAVKTSGFINFIFGKAGSHHRVFPYRMMNGENTIDAAVALPVNEKAVKNSILDIGTVEGTEDPRLGMKVQKSGRTSGLTEGTVDVIDTTVNVFYGEFRPAIFSHQVVTSMVSQPGDSGSLAVTGRKAVGLLFAGSETTSILNPILYVCDALNITL